MKASNYGDGFGCAEGYGDSYAEGSGHGYVEGFGYGEGDGYGYGHGNGYGISSRCGHGHGYGDDFDKVEEIEDYPVRVNKKFRLVWVGCQVHTLEHWIDNWDSIALEEQVEVRPDDVFDLIVLIKRGFGENERMCFRVR